VTDCTARWLHTVSLRFDINLMCLNAVAALSSLQVDICCYFTSSVSILPS